MISDNNSALQQPIRGGSLGTREEDPNKFPYEAFTVTKGSDQNTLSMVEGWEFDTGYNIIFGGTPDEVPEDIIFGGQI